MNHLKDVSRPAAPATEADDLGWVSPTYTNSRSVTLDRARAIENRCVAFAPNAAELEAYRVLRTQILQRTAGSEGTTIMVTSALPGEGKTLTAINLTATFAMEFKQTALLVDCDLRQQRVCEVLGYQSEKGLVDFLLDKAPMSELIVWPGIEKMTVISGGRTVSGSTEILGSPRMRNLVADMKSRYPERFVFFDVPPVLTCADALAFAPLVDYIVVTVEAGRTPLPEVQRAVAMLPKEKILGLVLNRC